MRDKAAELSEVDRFRFRATKIERCHACECLLGTVFSTRIEVPQLGNDAAVFVDTCGSYYCQALAKRQAIEELTAILTSDPRS